MRISLEKDNEEWCIPPLVLPNGTNESQIAFIMTSIILRAALEASTPWHKWILLSALQLLHGEKPAALDLQTFSYFNNLEKVANKFPHIPQAGSLNLSDNPKCQKSNELGEAASHFHLNLTNERKHSSDESLRCPLDGPPSKILHTGFNDNLNEEENVFKQTPQLLQRKIIRHDISPPLQILDKANSDTNGAPEDIALCEPPSTLKNAENVNVDLSFTFDPSNLFLSPPYAVSSPKKSLLSPSQLNLLVPDNHIQPMTHGSSFCGASPKFRKSSKSLNNTKATALKYSNADAKKPDTPSFSKKSTIENTFQNGPAHQKPIASGCKISRSKTFTSEVNSKSTLNCNTCDSQRKSPSHSLDAEALKCKLSCRKTPVVILKKEDMEAAENHLKSTVKLSSSSGNLATDLHEAMLKRNVSTQVWCETTCCGIQVKPSTCTKWIQVRKKKFTDQAVQAVLPKHAKNIDEISQTYLKDITVDICAKSKLVDRTANQVNKRSVETQTDPRRKKWKLELLSDLPAYAQHRYQSSVDPLGNPLFHGNPLNFYRDYTPFIPLLWADTSIPARDPRLE